MLVVVLLPITQIQWPKNMEITLYEKSVKCIVVDSVNVANASVGCVHVTL